MMNTLLQTLKDKEAVQNDLTSTQQSLNQIYTLLNDINQKLDSLEKADNKTTTVTGSSSQEIKDSLNKYTSLRDDTWQKSN